MSTNSTAYNAWYYATHKEKLKNYKREWWIKNREKYLEKMRTYTREWRAKRKAGEATNESIVRTTGSVRDLRNKAGNSARNSPKKRGGSKHTSR